MTTFLEGDRIYLRTLDDEDADDAVRWFNDAEVCAGNSHHVYPFGINDALDYIWKTDDFALAIMVRAFEEHIGNVALQNIHPVYRSADLSIIIGERDYWGKGYGKEACTLLIDHAFNAMGLLRIACATFDNNYGMRKLAILLGFREEGNRIAAAYKNGKYVDILEFGLLRKDWNK